MNQQLKKADGDSERATLADDGEAAQYVSDLVSQLERLARSHGLVKLQYLLKVCREEADAIAGGIAR